MSLAQTRFLFTTKKIAPNFKRVFGQIFSNLKKMFWSKNTLFNLGKTLAKAAIVFGMAFMFVVNDLGTIISYTHMDSNLAAGTMFSIIIKFVFSAGFILFLLAVSDYRFNYIEYTDSLKMTKEEVKQEFKEMEGNPEIKQKIRQLENNLGRRRMMKDVPTADVIITNPTHYAVALRYTQGQMNAPKVVAKGVDRTALKIREIASEHGIVIHENKALARALHANVEIGDEIPPEYFQLVAEVLKIVYTQRDTLLQQ